MKRKMNYGELRSIADAIAQDIKATVENPMLFAVVRGGMTLAQLVAYRLALPLGVYYPKLSCLVHPDLSSDYNRDPEYYVFLEDVLATGRTLASVRALMDSNECDWKFYPSVIDAKLGKFPNVSYETALVSEDWIVFPYENIEEVVEGDHGLFREGTSENSKEKS